MWYVLSQFLTIYVLVRFTTNDLYDTNSVLEVRQIYYVIVIHRVPSFD